MKELKSCYLSTSSKIYEKKHSFLFTIKDSEMFMEEGAM